MLLSILLVSHNSLKDLRILLPSLKRALKNIHSEILLVDNCSGDSTVDFVKREFPDISLLVNERAAGYGANQNRNIRRANGKFLLIMNPDMVVPDNLFNVLLYFAREHNDAGIITCRICNSDGSCQFLNKREPAAIDLFIRRFMKPFILNIIPHQLSRIIMKRAAHYEMRDTGYDNIVDVPFISGSFMFARADAIKKLGGFDERFFMYFEDVDLCRRARTFFRCIYCPDVSVIHRWERASHKSMKWTLVFLISGLKYYHKWGFRLL